ncbi:hypothetical protein L218DRAFT_1001686 [Marasmius fiardii PR-910]|nr:hypothetical protein L218DRAFT_1001686 [Marasmius fiardii PR-910]
MHLKIATLVVVAGIQAAIAQTSLWIPGFDEQALSADVIGVDTANGRTSYRIQRGASTAANDDESGFTGTFTLVAGTNYASYNYAQNGVSITYDCSISGSLGLCSGSDGSTIATATETVRPFLVQGGGTVTNTAPTGTPTNAGGQTTGGTGTGGATRSNPMPTQTNNNGASGSSNPLTKAGIVLGAFGVIFLVL